MATENETYESKLKGIVSNLPEGPGIYQYLDEEGTIIYVGKAKNLKRRVSSYFNKDHDSLKTRLLVRKIRDIKYIVVRSEEDALLLENNLIKRYQPHYNVLLKDDKTYPSICVSKEEFPRIFKTRHIDKRGGVYFGPYTHLPSMYAVLELIGKIFRVRSCRFPLHEENIAKGKYKVCLDYHIKKCDGPCIGAISRGQYNENIERAKKILRGNTEEISREYLQEMKAAAAEMRFEDAQRAKEMYELIEGYKAKSEIVSRSVTNVDVFSILSDEKVAYINYLHITQGSINQAFTFEYKKKLDETDEELLLMGIVEMRERYGSTSPEIVVPFRPEVEMQGVEFTVPKAGERKKLLDLSLLNVKQYKLDRLKQAEKLNPEQRSVRLMKEIQEQLRLPKLPNRIECFDNSHIQGSDAVAGCVVFLKAKPAKSEYRKYQIKGGEGGDDYGSMREVAFRRYKRAVEEGSPLPDLIVADGGKGQMEALRQVTYGELGLDIPILGLAKDRKHRTSEVLYGFPAVVVGIKQGTALFHLLERIQDEVHRYAISYHRDRRSKGQTHSALDEIKGIGPKTKDLLLKKYKSLKRIGEADPAEIGALIGQKKAEALLRALRPAPPAAPGEAEKA